MLELSDSCDLDYEFVIVNSNHDYDSMQSYYRDILLQQKTTTTG